jgi:glutamate receptor, ionotropic, invertebrate
MLLNKRHLEKLKEKWWKNDDIQSKCEKPEDQSDGISIQNIGGVFIVIFVGIGMACVTLIFEYWYYKLRKVVKIVDVAETKSSEFTKQDSFSITKLDSEISNPVLRPRGQLPQTTFRARF